MSGARAALLARLDEPFDVLVIGGGATGLGAALDATTRGYRTALVEAGDFAESTSSRSTKLVHGGVRYLQQGDVGLVREALHERANLRRNAAHLVSSLPFLLPLYRALDVPYYLAGLKAYDLLGRGTAFPRSRFVGRRETLARLPDLAPRGLCGSIEYADGLFDDARLALALARTAADRGATVLNYVRATAFSYRDGRACGAAVRDEETGAETTVRAKVVVNATGIFVDATRRLDDASAPALLAHSRGSHLVFARDAFRGVDALLVPKTSDGRVLFAVPWYGHVVVGTTDIPAATAEMHPHATRDEADFIVAQFNAYVARPIARRDALAIFAGLRPLVRRSAATTAKLSREHVVDVSPSGIVTVTGGKWTTYRKMAQDTIDVAARIGALAAAPSRTVTLSLRGNPEASDASAGAARDASAAGIAGSRETDGYAVYGTDRAALLALEAADPTLAARLDPRLPYTAASVAYAAREEFARTVDDVLARRTRATFLDVAAARASAPAVARLLAAELGRDRAWVDAQVAAFEARAVEDAGALG